MESRNGPSTTYQNRCAVPYAETGCSEPACDWRPVGLRPAADAPLRSAGSTSPPVPSPVKDGGVLWTRDNVGEVLPQPVTPLTWSVLERTGNGAFRGLLRRLGVRGYPERGLFGCFHGYVYLNRTAYDDLIRQFSLSAVAAGERGWRRLWRWLKAGPGLLLRGLRVGVLFFTLPRQVRNFPLSLESELKGLDDASLNRCSVSELFSHLERMLHLNAQGMEIHLSCTILAGLLYYLLDKLVTRWRGEEQAITVTTLLAGLRGAKSAEPGRQLWHLAQEILDDDELRAVFQRHPPPVLEERLRTSPRGREFLVRLRRFLETYGHTSVQEFELSVPRWRDDPVYVLSVLRNHVRSGGDMDPEAVENERRQARLRATARMRQRLSGGWLERLFPVRRLLFDLVLLGAQHYSVARESMKYEFVRGHSHVRYLALELGWRFVLRGLLRSPEDVFFLTWDEMQALAENPRAVPVRELVPLRREEWDRYRAVGHATAPGEGVDGLDTALVALGDLWEHPLRGVGGSPGRASGRAKVILNPEGDAFLEAGEILIAPATTPGWAPLLMTAGAVVTEVGGLLSHGAIIAREYGIPAVMNVPGATRLIKTGQWVMVDGDAGLVYVEEDGQERGGAQR